MSKHVFISHSHKDSDVANTVLAALEQRGLTCWIAPRDVAPGGSYAESILTAIEKASCFVLIYSEHTNTSSHVLREVERALTFGVNIVPVRFDDSAPSKSLDYLLATVHWLAIPQESRDRSIAKAAQQIAEWLTNFLKNPAAPLPVRMPSALVTSLEPPPRRSYGMLVIAALLLALVAAGFVTGRLPFPEEKPIEVSSAKYKTGPARAAVAADLRQRAKAHQAIGYAGVDQPPATHPVPSVDHYNIESRPRQAEMPPPEMRPPPPPGPPPSQNILDPNFGAQPGNQFQPPPPPPPGGPMSGPRGPRRGGPPRP